MVIYIETTAVLFISLLYLMDIKQTVIWVLNKLGVRFYFILDVIFVFNQLKIIYFNYYRY
ncbi:hypothetical protein CWO07_05150 [Vibrio splendidus]|uniref:Uncharacterized protein n=1 Tax=Vibrio splendidus TaxID=29497 RepID=A0A2N7ED69_VIBSP|nr:hypothetical protein A150_03945 [Vibrio splendidus 1S-124]OEF79514.1 hypothetical protein A148_01700 [Vibrio splendidus 1F-157]PMH70723.1 hypothetical protein BCU61_07630 [Vibrio splendidus]PMI74207.1 hypothetical protein BCU38_15430 [Vibrio splendidus]PMJ31159.1 hypothetical protein BCU26_10880 [Vibrio splendidus]